MTVIPHPNQENRWVIVNNQTFYVRKVDGAFEAWGKLQEAVVFESKQEAEEVKEMF